MHCLNFVARENRFPIAMKAPCHKHLHFGMGFRDETQQHVHLVREIHVSDLIAKDLTQQLADYALGGRMKEEPVMTLDKPHFVVRIYNDWLEVDVKEGIKRHLEDLVESRPGLRETVGLLFQTVVPLDVDLSSIASVSIEKNQLKVAIPDRKDLHIPLDEAECSRVKEKLDELIPLAKLKRAEEEKEAAERRFQAETKPRTPPSSINRPL